MKPEAIGDLLKQLRSELELVLGDQMVGLYLYWSQARGDVRPDSDIDVLVVLRGKYQYFDMVQRTGEIAARLSLRLEAAQLLLEGGFTRIAASRAYYALKLLAGRGIFM